MEFRLLQNVFYFSAGNRKRKRVELTRIAREFRISIRKIDQFQNKAYRVSHKDVPLFTLVFWKKIFVKFKQTYLDQSKSRSRLLKILDLNLTTPLFDKKNKDYDFQKTEKYGLFNIFSANCSNLTNDTPKFKLDLPLSN